PLPAGFPWLQRNAVELQRECGHAVSHRSCDRALAPGGAGGCDLFANDFREAKHARTCRIAVGEDEIDLLDALRAAAQRQRLERAVGEFVADLVHRKPREAIPATDRADG